MLVDILVDIADNPDQKNANLLHWVFVAGNHYVHYWIIKNIL